MHSWKFPAFFTLAALFAVAPGTTDLAAAQISINIGESPVCPYGYFAYPPYQCAPYGFYGPDWFDGGLFIGAGPWYHGRDHFYGHVDNRYDPHHGYHGPLPERGAEPFNHFHGNVAVDPRGRVGHADHGPEGERSGGFAGHGGPGGHGGSDATVNTH